MKLFIVLLLIVLVLVAGCGDAGDATGNAAKERAADKEVYNEIGSLDEEEGMEDFELEDVI